MTHPDLRVPPLDKQGYNKLSRATIEALNKPGATNWAGRVAIMPNGAFAFITSPRDGLLSTSRKPFEEGTQEESTTKENKDDKDAEDDIVENEAEAR